MHTPSPSPQLAPSPSASSSQLTMANEAPMHMTHHGSDAAWPSISSTLHTYGWLGFEAPEHVTTSAHDIQPNTTQSTTEGEATHTTFLDIEPTPCAAISDDNDVFQSQTQPRAYDLLASSPSNLMAASPSIPAYTQYNFWPPGNGNSGPLVPQEVPAGRSFMDNFNNVESFPQVNGASIMGNPFLFPYDATAHSSFGNAAFFLSPFALAPPKTPCPWPNCSETFVRSTDVNRHIQSVHQGIRHQCYWIGCPNNGGKGYCRLEKLKTHQRQKHGFVWDGVAWV